MRVRLAGTSRGGPGPGDVVQQRLLGPPVTRLGGVSLALLGIAVAWLVIPMVAVTAGVDNSSALVPEILLLAIPLFLAFACAISAGVAAAISLLRDGERSLLLALPLLAGALALIFAIGEFTTPH